MTDTLMVRAQKTSIHAVHTVASNIKKLIEKEVMAAAEKGYSKKIIHVESDVGHITDHAIEITKRWLEGEGFRPAIEQGAGRLIITVSW
jgi:hypothetical protein